MLLTKLSVSQQLAKQLVGKVEEEAINNNLTVSIALVNECGQLIHFTKMDGSSNISGQHAIAKAKHAVNYRRDTKFHEELLAQGNLRVLALPDSLPVEGGVQLIYKGKVVGAIGVSGAPSAEDGKIAAIAAAYLTTLEV